MVKPCSGVPAPRRTFTNTVVVSNPEIDTTVNESKSPVINKSILKALAGNLFNDLGLCLLRQIKVPTTGQTSGERAGQSLGKQSTQGTGSLNG
jgi:hypothetical protein